MTSIVMVLALPMVMLIMLVMLMAATDHVRPLLLAAIFLIGRAISCSYDLKNTICSIYSKNILEFQIDTFYITP